MFRDYLRSGLAVAAIAIFFSLHGHAQLNQDSSSGSRLGSGTLGSSISARGAERSDSTARGTSGLGIVPADFEKLKIEPGFLVSLSVLDDPDYDGAYRVDQLGNITVPFLNDIHVNDQTVGEAREKIRSMLVDRKIMVDPQVQVAIVEYSAPQVTIVGEVSQPGKYPLIAPRKLVDVLALAGGPTNYAGSEVSIVSGGQPDAKPVNVHYSNNTDTKEIEQVMVNPGDTVQVKRAGIIYVLGAVNRPGGFLMQQEGTLTLLQAMSLASGTSQFASIKSIYLLHRNQDGSLLRMTVPYKEIANGKSADVALHSTDIVFVPDSKLKTVFSSTQGIMTSVATASVYHAF